MRVNRWIIVGAACFGLVLVLGFIKFMQIRAAIAFGESFPEPSETVEIQAVEFSDWQARISVIGEVRASRELVLRNEVEGIIAKIGFESGGQVEEGDILLQLDISEEEARLEAIEPQIELARQDVKRVSGLTDQSAVSRQRADGFRAQLAISKAEAASVREIIANKTVVAPFTGYAGLHDFEIGEYLPANTLITNLVGNLDTLWVDFSVPQRYAQLQAGEQVTITAPDVTDLVLTANVSAVEPNISSESRNLNARAVLADPNRLLKPGVIVRVSAPIGEPRRIVRLPSTAVRTDTFGSYVFTLIKDGSKQWRAARRPVVVIAKDGDDSIITQGLEPGEEIATTGSFKLREGLLVYQSQEQSNLAAQKAALEAPPPVEQQAENSTSPEPETPAADQAQLDDVNATTIEGTDGGY